MAKKMQGMEGLCKGRHYEFLPEVWMPPEDVELQRRVVAERTQLVGQMTRLKNRIQSIFMPT